MNSYHSQINELHQNFAEKLPLFQECQSGLRDINNTINDLRIEISQIRTDVNREFRQFNKDVDKKISKLQEDIVSQVKTDSRNQKKQMRRMWNAMIALFILWLCLAAFVLVK